LSISYPLILSALLPLFGCGGSNTPPGEDARAKATAVAVRPEAASATGGPGTGRTDAQAPNPTTVAGRPEAEGATGESSPQRIFERRLLPIFNSSNPSSCTQCHLAGLDLKNYILPSHEKTFLSLRDQGLIDLERPADSKILRLIEMGEKDKQTTLIQEKVRRAEYEAFAEWIKASCADANLRQAPPLPPGELARPERPPEVIRHARTDKLLESFEKNVWSQRFRCVLCHMPGGAENAKLVAENGDRVSWVKAEGAEATMRYLMGSKLIDTRQPGRSLLLRKPMQDETKHGGGQKMVPGDMGYKGFRTWLEDYAAVVGDKYARAGDLPRDKDGPRHYGSEIWVKLEGTPPAWADRLLQVTVYAWDARNKAWEGEPVAVSDRAVWGAGRLWQHNLILLAAPGSARARAWENGRASLPPGRYLIKVHVDTDGRLRRDWQAELGEGEFIGQAEIETRWPEGYGNMTALPSARLRR
jgi:hypothetical protein